MPPFPARTLPLMEPEEVDSRRSRVLLVSTVSFGFHGSQPPPAIRMLMDPDCVLSRITAVLLPGLGSTVMEMLPEVVSRSRRSYSWNVPWMEFDVSC